VIAQHLAQARGQRGMDGLSQAAWRRRGP
jgi:hypothetical protein